MLSDSILIIFIAVFTALLSEGLSWLLIYRTEKYKRLQAEVEKQSKKLEKQKESLPDMSDKNHKKKLERQEEKLKLNNRELSMVKMKSMMTISFAFMALLSMFNSIFEGRVVAKLPFEPISWIRGISHRNLNGEDYTDCSFLFLYILSTMFIRQNLQKILGVEPSRAASKMGNGFFTPPSQAGASPFLK
ncbi:unnamed protein product [Brachionus calyciflorus]|uniref:Calcium load-activated calcium channel n=1 Tax=Brachionus calyciflorus TaxID=104777 RepID=A0A814RYS1_9BILA|nr:unnamed protein product [Brachionus calyciflorus]